MATNLEIANQALAELGSAPITQTDFDTPTSASARVIGSVFVPVIKEVLSQYDFPIIRGSAAFTSVVSTRSYNQYPEGAFLYLQPEAEAATYDSDQWKYTFDLGLIPNFSFLRKITTPDGCEICDYYLENTLLLVNRDTVFVHFTKTITDASVLPEYLIPSIVYRLAARIAKPLTGEITEREMMNREFEKAFKRAKRRASHDKAPLSYLTDEGMGYITAHQKSTCSPTWSPDYL
jgi:hypothetical protein|tara:strand:- start:3274 stop:3975 length:702 start_codon:yes stop_codon:yes gene_type:complete